MIVKPLFCFCFTIKNYDCQTLFFIVVSLEMIGLWSHMLLLKSKLYYLLVVSKLPELSPSLCLLLHV